MAITPVQNKKKPVSIKDSTVQLIILEAKNLLFTHYLKGSFIFSRLCSPSEQEVSPYYHFLAFDIQNNSVMRPTPTQINALGKRFPSLSVQVEMLKQQF